MQGLDSPSAAYGLFADAEARNRAHPDLNQGPADLQSAALTTELCTRMLAPARNGSHREDNLRVALKVWCGTPIQSQDPSAAEWCSG